jgi:uncharacterized protein (TIGR02145 family)
MAIKIGTVDLDQSKIYIGTQEIGAVYVGANKVWPPDAPIVFDEVIIGTQTWMVKNLDIDDGLGGIYAYNNDEANVATYGRLYTWDAAVRVAASIEGWHLPSDAEWTTLTTYLGGTSVAGGKLKETGTTHWRSPNTGATNESGFTILPGGFRYNVSAYSNINTNALLWSITEYNTTNVIHLSTNYNTSKTFVPNIPKNYGLSVRLVKD